jgi:hypothetical protein
MMNNVYSTRISWAHLEFRCDERILLPGIDRPTQAWRVGAAWRVARLRDHHPIRSQDSCSSGVFYGLGPADGKDCMHNFWLSHVVN